MCLWLCVYLLHITVQICTVVKRIADKPCQLTFRRCRDFGFFTSSGQQPGVHRVGLRLSGYQLLHQDIPGDEGQHAEGIL